MIWTRVSSLASAGRDQAGADRLTENFVKMADYKRLSLVGGRVYPLVSCQKFFVADALQQSAVNPHFFVESRRYLTHRAFEVGQMRNFSRNDENFKGLCRFVVWNPCPVRRLQRAVSDFSEVKLMETKCPLPR